EDGGLPGGYVEEQSALLQVVTVPVVRGIPQQVRQPPPVFPEVCERQPHVTLALVSRIVHRHQQALLPLTPTPLPRGERGRGEGGLPGERQEAVPGPVPLPGGNTLEQLPLTLADRRVAEHSEEPVVEPGNLLVDRLGRATYQMGGNPFRPPLE